MCLLWRVQCDRLNQPKWLRILQSDNRSWSLPCKSRKKPWQQRRSHHLPVALRGSLDAKGYLRPTPGNAEFCCFCGIRVRSVRVVGDCVAIWIGDGSSCLTCTAIWSNLSSAFGRYCATQVGVTRPVVTLSITKSSRGLVPQHTVVSGIIVKRVCSVERIVVDVVVRPRSIRNAPRVAGRSSTGDWLRPVNDTQPQHRRLAARESPKPNPVSTETRRCWKC